MSNFFGSSVIIFLRKEYLSIGLTKVITMSRINEYVFVFLEKQTTTNPQQNYIIILPRNHSE